MSDLIAFFDEIEQNEDLRKAFSELQDLEDICKLAESYGYHFSAEELEDYYFQQVAGGTFVNRTDMSASINQNVDGDGNYVVNSGDAVVYSSLTKAVDSANDSPLSGAEKLAFAADIIKYKLGTKSKGL